MTYPRPLLSALSILALTACGGDSDSTDDGSSSDTGVVTDSGSSDTGTVPEETALQEHRGRLLSRRLHWGPRHPPKTLPQNNPKTPQTK